MTRLIIARHGNTFTSDQTPTRVGARTDLDLVESGQEQAKKLGIYLTNQNISPQKVFTSNLKRTIQTAEIALKNMNLNVQTEQSPMFNEVDYGPDENKVENDVIARIGEQAIKDWDSDAIVPQGWKINPQQVIHDWNNFAEQIKNEQCVMVVTSNGIARFAPYITGDFESFKNNFSIKLSTGALGILEFDGSKWSVKEWNTKPKDFV